MPLTDEEIRQYRAQYGLDGQQAASPTRETTSLTDWEGKYKPSKGAILPELSYTPTVPGTAGSTTQRLTEGLPGTVGAVGNVLVGAAKAVPETAADVLYAGQKLGEKIGLPQPEWSKETTYAGIEGLTKLAEPTTKGQEAGKKTVELAMWLPLTAPINVASKALEATKAAKMLAKTPLVGGILETAFTKGVPEAIGAAGMEGLQTRWDEEKTIAMAKFAGLIPVAFKGLSMLPGTSTLKSFATGVSKEVWERVKTMPIAYESAMTHVRENEKEPFYYLASEVAKRVHAGYLQAKQNFEATVATIKQRFPNKTFNFDTKVPNLKKALADFNLTIKQVRVNGKLTGELYITPTTRTSPFTDKEVAAIDTLFKKMRTKDMTIDEVVDFATSVRNFYQDAAKAEDKKMMAIGYALTKEASKYISDIVPELRAANQLYENYHLAMQSGASKIVDADGNIKQGATQFLSNLSNTTKDVARKDMAAVEELTGMPIVDSAMIFKDAIELNKLVAGTGFKAYSIVRGLVAAGLGYTFLGGLPGMAVTAALTSPKVLAEETIATAKAARALKGAAKKVTKPITENIPAITKTIQGLKERFLPSSKTTAQKKNK